MLVFTDDSEFFFYINEILKVYYKCIITDFKIVYKIHYLIEH